MYSLIAKMDLTKPGTLEILNAESLVPFQKIVIGMLILAIVLNLITRLSNNEIIKDKLAFWRISGNVLTTLMMLGYIISFESLPFNTGNFKNTSIEINTNSKNFQTYFKSQDELMLVAGGRQSFLDQRHFFVKGENLYFTKITPIQGLVTQDKGCIFKRDQIEDSLGYDALEWLQSCYKKTGRNPVDAIIK